MANKRYTREMLEFSLLEKYKTNYPKYFIIVTHSSAIIKKIAHDSTSVDLRTPEKT